MLFYRHGSTEVRQGSDGRAGGVARLCAHLVPTTGLQDKVHPMEDLRKTEGVQGLHRKA